MKNCCDYDVITHYHSGEFNVKYKTVLSGKLKEIERIPYGPQVTNSFRDGKYKTFSTIEPLELYRVFGEYSSAENIVPKGARLGGSFATTEFAESVIDAKLRLALDPAWANTKMYEARLVVPTGITLSIGVVASVRLKTGTLLPGGADQILLPQNWPYNWITGYRRLTGRQLKVPPYYSLQRPCGNDKKEDLYRIVCPACGCEKCRKLLDEEQFTTVGKRGNQYVMKYVCMNPHCQYYW